MKFGVDPLPRLLRRGRRAPRRAGASATPSCSGTATATCSGVDAVVVPGGFSYGDYLRAGAIARFSPVMEAVARFARDGGPVLGICNGFQVLCEARPAARRAAAQRVPALRLPPGRRRGREPRHPLHARVRGGRAAVDPGQAHDRPLLRARGRARRAGGRRPGRAALRAAARTPTARRATSPACRNEQRQRHRPDAAPRARGRPAHRLGRRRQLFESLVAHVAAVARREPAARRTRHRELGLTDAEYDAIVERLGREPNDARAGGVLADVVRALRLQALEEAAAHAAHRGPARGDGAGRERRRGRRRRRAGGGVQGRVAQPPERGRALPGRGHRRRRHPARRVRDRRAADRRSSTRCASASSTRARSRYLLERVGGGHRPLRQLDRRGHRRRRDLLRGALRAELPGQRDVRGPRADATG